MLGLEKCVIKDKTGALTILKSAKAQFKFDSLGLSSGTVSDFGCYWLNKKGTLMKTHCFDNGADYFQDGLARYIDDKGKFGFMNEKLQIKIPAQYSFAFPFEYGNAKVCNGCAPLKGKATDHSIIDGGKWQIIDKTGKLVKDCSNAKREYQCSR